MAIPTHSHPFHLKQYYRVLIALSFSIAGLCQGVLPALANGTQAGTSIRNAATATYADPSNPSTSISATSNEVIVTVAEIAGITVSDSGNIFSNDADNSGTVTAGDEVYFLFTVTNVGNDPTQFRIPNLATTTGPASVTSGANLEVSNDGGTTWVAISGSELITSSKAPGETVQVRVPVSITATAQANETVTVQLGNAPANAQNIERDVTGGDVFTVDGPDGAANDAEIDGAPANGVREASAIQQVNIAESLKTYTLATLLKVRSGHDDQGTAAIADDQLTYDLNLRIENSDPSGNDITPAPLSGTEISVTGGNPALDNSHSYVLVSDAIPTGTDFAGIGTVPNGWTVVYTTEALDIADAHVANWTADIPADLTTITRVGFVYDTTVQGAIAIGQTLPSFSIILDVEDTAVAPLTVANLAQVFGSSPTGAPVYDESGDQSPSNYGDENGPNSLPPGTTDNNNDNIPDPNSSLDSAGVDDGFVDSPTNPEMGVDTAGDNSGDSTPNTPSEGGEANVFVISLPEVADIQTGPTNAAAATGPSGATTDDFSNRSTPVLSGTGPGEQIDPAAVSFTNALTNNGQATGTVTLAPSTTLSDGTAVDLSQLPANTTVTLSYQSQSATYEWSGTGFTLTAGTALSIVNFAATDSISYGVEIDLPNGTPLSTDSIGANPTDLNAATIGGFALPILATLDTTPTDLTDPAQASNSTINRVYTGYLKLIKESRLLQGSGPEIATGNETFSAIAKSPATGNIIEYRITYRNISEAQSGVGNVILNVGNLVITESGTAGDNNWALDNDNNGAIDSSNVPGSASDSNSGTITFFPTGDQTGTTAATDVTDYVNTLPGVIAPQGSGEFIFQRRIN